MRLKFMQQVQRPCKNTRVSERRAGLAPGRAIATKRHDDSCIFQPHADATPKLDCESQIECPDHDENIACRRSALPWERDFRAIKIARCHHETDHR